MKKFEVEKREPIIYFIRKQSEEQSKKFLQSTHSCFLLALTKPNFF